MASIITLSWSGGVAYGTGGARYELEERGGLHFCRVYTDVDPNGTVIAANEGTREGAMLSAQRHSEGLATILEAENTALQVTGGRVVG